MSMITNAIGIQGASGLWPANGIQVKKAKSVRAQIEQMSGYRSNLRGEEMARLVEAPWLGRVPRANRNCQRLTALGARCLPMCRAPRPR